MSSNPSRRYLLLMLCLQSIWDIRYPPQVNEKCPRKKYRHAFPGIKQAFGAQVTAVLSIQEGRES